jgi:hypothetical protein
MVKNIQLVNEAIIIKKGLCMRSRLRYLYSCKPLFTKVSGVLNKKVRQNCALVGTNSFSIPENAK